MPSTTVLWLSPPMLHGFAPPRRARDLATVLPFATPELVAGEDTLAAVDVAELRPAVIFAPDLLEIRGGLE